MEYRYTRYSLLDTGVFCKAFKISAETGASNLSRKYANVSLKGITNRRFRAWIRRRLQSISDFATFRIIIASATQRKWGTSSQAAPCTQTCKSWSVGFRVRVDTPWMLIACAPSQKSSSASAAGFPDKMCQWKSSSQSLLSLKGLRVSK